MLTEDQINQAAELAAKHARERTLLQGRHANEREQLAMAQAAELQTLEAEMGGKTK